MGLVVEQNLKRRFGDRTLTPTMNVVGYDDYGLNHNKMYDATCPVSHHYSEFVGWDIPNFHKRRRLGEMLPHTPWYQLTFDVSFPEGVWDYQYTSSGNLHHNYILNGAASHTFSIPNLATERANMEALVPLTYDKYVQEAAAAIYSSNYDLLTFVAELADVRHLFKETAKKLINLKLPKNWRQHSSEWLSFRYGWRTLLYDIKNIEEMIANLDERRTRLSERRGNTISSFTTTQVDAEWPYFTNQNINTVESVVKVTGSVNADIVLQAVQLNLFVTAWEKIPFSFVIDWFLRVGVWINAASFLVFETRYACSKGYHIKRVVNFSEHFGAAKTGYVDGKIERNRRVETKLTVRTPCVVPVTPHLSWKLDGFKVLDLMTLVIQRFRR
jgi:hypothetical protein